MLYTDNGRGSLKNDVRSQNDHFRPTLISDLILLQKKKKSINMKASLIMYSGAFRLIGEIKTLTAWVLTLVVRI